MVSSYKKRETDVSSGRTAGNGYRTNLCATAVNDDGRINAGTGHLGELSVLIDVDFIKVELAIYFGEFGECREDRLRGKSVALNG